MEDKIAIQGMMNMFNDGRQEAAEKCYEFIKQYFKNCCDEDEGFLFDFEDFLKEEFNIIIDPTAVVCKHYDNANQRCMGAKGIPYTECKGYLSRCSEYPETRKKYSK